MASDLLARGRARAPLAAALLALACFSAAPPALAQQPSAADKETARALMDKGDEKMDAKDFTAALKAYEAADAIMHLPMTGVAVARAQAAAGLLVEARDKAMTVARSSAQPGESAPYARARAEAAELANALASRIPSIQVTIAKPPPNITVSVDGVAVPAAAALELRKVNPGKHTITVTGPGVEPARVDIEVREGTQVPVPVVLKPLSGAPAPPPKALPDNPPPPPPPPPDKPSGGVSPLAWVGFSVGGAALIAGGITGGMSLAKTANLKERCPDDACPPGSGADISTANTLANISNVTIGVGLAGVVVGVVGLVISKKPAAPPATAHVEPWIGAGLVGARGAF